MKTYRQYCEEYTDAAGKSLKIKGDTALIPSFELWITAHFLMDNGFDFIGDILSDRFKELLYEVELKDQRLYEVLLIGVIGIMEQNKK